MTKGAGIRGDAARLAASLLRLACAVVLTGGVALASGEEPREWLRDMGEAFNDLSYDGIFSYYNGRDLTSLRVVHMVVDGEQQERLVHLNGAPREIVRHGDQVECIVMPGDALLEVEDSIPAGPFARAFLRSYERISENYDLSFVGEDRVADRAAVRVAVTPRDDHRYAYRLWLDAETRLLLRSELVGLEGERLEIFQFNRIEFGDAVDPDTVKPDGGEGALVSELTLASEKAEPAPGDELGWQVAWLPDGFSMAAADVRRAPSASRPVDTLMYSDGLAAFSLFIEDVPEAGAAPMVSRNGATVAVSRVVHGGGDTPYLVTLVGEIPTATAERIAGSVSKRSGAGTTSDG